jgi:hypothetical protein
MEMLLLLTILLTTQESPSDLLLQTFKGPGENLKLVLPRSYEKDSKISLMFTRNANHETNDVVSLRMAFLNQKLPLVPVAPTEADLLKVDPSLTYVKFTGSVGTWQGRPVPMGRYEGFVQGKIGVYGRVVWLPLEPGIVVLDLYAEPAWMGGMNHDWDIILGNLSGPIVELTLREKAPRRWLTARILGGFGIVVASVGILMLIARMNESIGGSLTFAGLILPVIPLGYALFHLHECRKGIVVALTGLGILGLSLLLLR